MLFGVRKCNRCGHFLSCASQMASGCLRKLYDSSSLVVSSEGFFPSLMHHATSTADIWYLLSGHLQLQWFHAMLSAHWCTMTVSVCYSRQACFFTSSQPLLVGEVAALPHVVVRPTTAFILWIDLLFFDCHPLSVLFS